MKVMKMKRKLLAILVSLAMVFTMMPLMTGTVHAAAEITVDGIKYILNDDNTAAVANYQDRNITGKVTIPSTINADGVSYSVTSIKEQAFYWCTELTSINMPSSVTSIGWSAFYFCNSLESITIPPNITNIEKSTFYGCASLRDITIPSSVNSIGGYAFSNCSNLTKISIPSSVNSIGEYAFRYCSNLTKIIIPCDFDKNIFSNSYVIPSQSDDTFMISNTNLTGTFEYIHDTLTHNDAVAPTCMEDGILEHWSCSKCNKNFSDEQGTNELINITDESRHTMSTEWSTDGEKHWHECTVCHTKKDEDAHIWSSDWITDGDKHWHECSACGMKKDEVAHTWNTEWSTNGDKHWHECSTCGMKKDEVAHTWNTEWSTNGDKHWHECTVCHTKKDEDTHIWSSDWITDGEKHWHECTACGKKKDEAAHTWSTVWSTDGEKHWHECTVCHTKKDEDTHIWSSDWITDGENHWHDCTVCGEKKDEDAHTWSIEWSKDRENHWHECSACGEKKDETVHTWVDATCSEAKTCEICDTTEGDPLGHKYGEWTNLDATQHQRVCEYDANHVEKENHKWDAGKVTKKATEEAEGVKTFTCTVCKATKTEVIPKLKPSDKPLAKIKAGKKSLTIGWNKIQGAEGYDIFFATCNHSGKKIACKNVKTIKGNKTFKWTKSGLKKGTAYKFYVRAYVTKNGKKSYVSKSPMFHAYTGNGTKNYTSAKSVTVNKTKVTLKKGKTFKIKAKVNKVNKKKKLMPKSHAPALRYMTSNKKIATVSSSGKITAKGKGTCNIIVYAHNGVSKSIKVTVP